MGAAGATALRLELLGLAANHLLQVVEEIFIADLVIGLTTYVNKVTRRGTGQPHVGFAGFAGAVDDAADHRHIHRGTYIFQSLLQRIHGLDHIKILP